MASDMSSLPDKLWMEFFPFSQASGSKMVNYFDDKPDDMKEEQKVSKEYLQFDWDATLKKWSKKWIEEHWVDVEYFIND